MSGGKSGVRGGMGILYLLDPLDIFGTRGIVVTKLGHEKGV